VATLREKLAVIEQNLFTESTLLLHSSSQHHKGSFWSAEDEVEVGAIARAISSESSRRKVAAELDSPFSTPPVSRNNSGAVDLPGSASPKHASQHLKLYYGWNSAASKSQSQPQPQPARAKENDTVYNEHAAPRPSDIAPSNSSAVPSHARHPTSFFHAIAPPKTGLTCDSQAPQQLPIAPVHPHFEKGATMGGMSSLDIWGTTTSLLPMAAVAATAKKDVTVTENSTGSNFFAQLLTSSGGLDEAETDQA
jgi:hypothetical protein